MPMMVPVLSPAVEEATAAAAAEFEGCAVGTCDGPGGIGMYVAGPVTTIAPPHMPVPAQPSRNVYVTVPGSVEVNVNSEHNPPHALLVALLSLVATKLPVLSYNFKNWSPLQVNALQPVITTVAPLLIKSPQAAQLCESETVLDAE